MDLNRVDLILKFALAYAGQKDPGERELGPIHLIKYVYLTDIFYAERHGGETFTGVPWEFYHYGPWSLDVFHRIEPVVKEVQALEKRFESVKYDNDFVRYSLEDEELLSELERQLPLEVSGKLSQIIKQIGDDTSALLHYVYSTLPMLKAAPRELLDFKEAVQPKEYTDQFATKAPVEKTPLSKTQKKKLEMALQAKKEAFRKRLAEKASKRRVTPPTPPPYNELFFEGLEWLDSLTGDPIEESQGELSVSPDIWKSRARWEQEP